jgi:simple sugar transport system ATP-binding protein
LPVDPAARIDRLSVGAQQRVEILKALAHGARVLILDEPTAVLAPDEVAALFATLERLRASGRAILLITHKLDEVLAAAQRVTVLREGRVALTAARADVTAASLTEALFGERPDATPRAASRAGGGDGRLALLATNLSGERFGPVELTLLGGECVVLFGLDGNGQSELVETLVGLREPSSGALERPRRADEVAFVSGDRHATGLALDLTVAENVGVKRGLLPRPWFTRAQLERAAAPPLARFAVASASLRQPVRELSGGNQQKLVLARELAREPRLVVAENPTRGLDLRATAFVRGELRRAVERGAAALVATTDLDEALELADRLFVVDGGRLFECERDRAAVASLLAQRAA